MEPRPTINEELEALEREAMNEVPRRERTISSSSNDSSSDSDHSYKKVSNEPPDYQTALKYRETKASDKDDNVNPSSDDQLPPPNYNSVI